MTPTLTERQKQILILICKEKSNKQIASELGIKTRTVERHKEILMLELDVETTVGLALWAVRNSIFNF